MQLETRHNQGRALRSKGVWLVVRQLRKAWFRVVAFALLALATVLVAPSVAKIVPPTWIGTFGTGAVDQVLNIMASSMLAVTTFSLSVAVSAFAGASQTATPRAAALLQEDPTTQNVLSTFLGAFLFSLVGVVALRAGLYSKAGEFVLFVATAGIIALVIVAFLRWTAHIMRFGRMEDTLDRVEAAAAEAVALRSESPCLGAAAWDGKPPQHASPVNGRSVGYVQHVDIPELSRIAEQNDVCIWIQASPGTFVHNGSILAYITPGELGQETEDAIRSAITCAKTRTFDQDPGYGIRVLSEVAIKALSTAVNDPGTAIDVIGRLVRILASWRPEQIETEENPRVFMEPVATDSLLEESMLPIAREAGRTVEVYTHIQRALHALVCSTGETFEESAVKISTATVKLGERAGLERSELEVG